MQIVLTKGRVTFLIACVAGAALYFLLSWLIVTDTKRVHALMGKMKDAVNRSDVEALAPMLDETFVVGTMDSATFRAWVREALNHYRVKNVSTYDANVEVKDDKATADVQTFVEVENPAMGRQRIDWTLTFIKRGEEWKLTGIHAFWPQPRQELPLGTFMNFP
jgi:hypothetical protein